MVLDLEMVELIVSDRPSASSVHSNHSPHELSRIFSLLGMSWK